MHKLYLLIFLFLQLFLLGMPLVVADDKKEINACQIINNNFKLSDVSYNYFAFLLDDLKIPHSEDISNANKLKIASILNDLTKAIEASDEQAIREWINSDERAIFFYRYAMDLIGSEKYASQEIKSKNANLYDVISYHFHRIFKFNAKINAPLLVNIINSHEFYNKEGIYKIKDEDSKFVTFSFEKEIKASAGLSYYQKENGDEFLSVMNLMNANLGKLYKSPVAPTIFDTPTYEKISEIDYLLEVKHHSYEMDSNRIYSQALQVYNDLKEAHSFHFHVVFDYNKIRMKKHSLDFFRWYFNVKQYYDFLGYEQGLHSNDYTGSDSYYNSSLEVSNQYFQSNYKIRSLKFASVGLRSADFYTTKDKTNEFDREYTKIGLELRDITRRFFDYKIYINKLANSTSKYIWEKTKVVDLPPRQLRGENVISDLHAEIAVAMASERLPYGVGKYFDDANKKIFQYIFNHVKDYRPTMIIPLLPYEDFLYFNYQTQNYENVTQEQRERIISARNSYIEEFNTTLAVEVKKYLAEKKSPDWDDMAMVLKMDLATWAKKAKISELYQNY